MYKATPLSHIYHPSSPSYTLMVSNTVAFTLSLQYQWQHTHTTNYKKLLMYATAADAAKSFVKQHKKTKQTQKNLQKYD